MFLKYKFAVPGDVLSDGEVRHRHHGNRGDGGQPVGLVIPADTVHTELSGLL
jgi:hypothetical protein